MPEGSIGLLDASNTELEILEKISLSEQHLQRPCIYGAWYIRFLRNRYSRLSSKLLTVLVPRPDVDLPEEIQRKSYDSFCKALLEITVLVSEPSDISRNLTFADIVLHLQSKSLLASGITEESESHRRIQFVFIAIGLLTMIYVPKLEPDEGKLQLEAIGAESTASKRKMWARTEIPIMDDSDSISDVILRMGQTKGPLPIPALCEREASFEGTDTLSASHLCYYSLTQLADIKIAWTDSIAEHLEFDQRLRILKLFCFPSYCALIAKERNEETFLCG